MSTEARRTPEWKTSCFFNRKKNREVVLQTTACRCLLVGTEDEEWENSPQQWRQDSVEAEVRAGLGRHWGNVLYQYLCQSFLIFSD